MRFIKKEVLAKFAIASVVLIISTAFWQQKEVWNAPESAKNKKNPAVSDQASIAVGKQAYEKECLSCHGKKGKGDGPNSATLEKEPGDLTSAKVQNQTDGELFWKITQGKKPMPATNLTLTDEQRWQVVNYIRTLGKKPSK